MRQCVSRVLFTLTVAITFTGLARAADDWKEPKDGLFTDKQVTAYAGAIKDWNETIKAYDKTLSGSKSGAGALIIAAGMEDKLNETLKKHDLKRGEFEWLSGNVFQYMGVATIDEQMELAKKEFADRKVKTVADIDAAKAKIAQYEQATKSSTRILTKEQRDDLTKSAKENQASADEEVKQHAQEAKDAADEAAKYEADARTADGLAKQPPADVEADSKADYIKGKQEEAETARNNAKESRDKEKEAKKAQTESKAKSLAAANQAVHPEIPVTDDEKAQAKQDNENSLTSAKDELKSLMQSADLLKDTDAQIAKQTAEMHKDLKEANLALVKKHLPELKEAWGMDKK